VVELTDSVSVSVLVHSTSNLRLLNRFSKKTLISVFFIVCCFLFQLQAIAQTCPTLDGFDQSELKSGAVDWVPDGDTIHTSKGNRLRLLHINAPETNATKPIAAEPMALQAKNELIRLIGESKAIYWLNDKRIKDKYGRELALVFNQAGDLINAQLVASGMAHILLIPPNDLFWRCMTAAEKKARRQSKGIWNFKVFRAKRVRQAGSSKNAPLKANQGFQLLSGKITQIKQTRNNRWLVLDDHLWVGIPNKNLELFAAEKIKFTQGKMVTLRGYVYHSYGKFRLKLKHPAMLLR